MTMTINAGATVLAADGERVGSVDRIVIDPLTKDVSHVVVRRGVLFREDKVIPIDMISTTNEEEIVLDAAVSEEHIQPFEETHYLSLTENAHYQSHIGSAPPLIYLTPYAPALAMPSVKTVRNHDIADRAIAVETGARVLASDGEQVGKLEQVLLTDAGVATHLVVDVGSFLVQGLKGLPMGWIESIDDDVVRLGVPASIIEAIPEYPATRDMDVPLT